MLKDDIIGVWMLQSWEMRAASGAVSHPYGEDAHGCLMYHKNGYMSVNLSMTERRPISSESAFGATPEELQHLAETFTSYCGQYEVLEDRVYHDVEICMLPNWVGERLTRFLKVTEDQLELSSPPMLVGGEQCTQHLRWRRVAS